MKLKNKENGVALIYVITMIIIMLIFATFGFINANNSINKTRALTFISEISTIQGQIKIYYAQHNEYPKLESSPYTLPDISTLTEQVGADASGQFYKLNILSLGLYNTLYGLDQTKQYNTYIISAQSNNVYYVKGVAIDGKVHHKVTKELLENYGSEDISNVVADEDAINKTVMFNLSTNIFTKNDVIVDVIYPTESSIKEYRINETGSFVNYTGPLTVTTNNTIIEAKYDLLDQGSLTAKTVIRNIDKIAPTIGLLGGVVSGVSQLNPNIIYVTVTEEGSSVQIKKWLTGIKATSDFYDNRGNSFNGDSFNVYNYGDYTVYVKDMAGNEMINTITLIEP